MTVKSKPLSPTRAPLSRHDLDRALPWLRLLVGAAFIGFSTVTTVAGVRADFAPLLVGDLYGVPVWVVAGLALSLLVTLGQWGTSDRWPLVYSALLLIDARYTQRAIGPAIETLAEYHSNGSALAWVVALVLSWLIALATARYGEVLLFGRRKGGNDERPVAGDGSDGAGAGAAGRD